MKPPGPYTPWLLVPQLKKEHMTSNKHNSETKWVQTTMYTYIYIYTCAQHILALSSLSLSGSPTVYIYTHVCVYIYTHTRFFRKCPERWIPSEHPQTNGAYLNESLAPDVAPRHWSAPDRTNSLTIRKMWHADQYRERMHEFKGAIQHPTVQ